VLLLDNIHRWWSGLENLCDLLFEVSNEDRLRILLQLDEEALNVTRLSRGLGLTT
jgi:hypothetical protein